MAPIRNRCQQSKTSTSNLANLFLTINFFFPCNLKFIFHSNQKSKNESKIQKTHISETPSRLCTCTRWCSVLTRVGWFRFTSMNKSAIRVTWNLFFIQTKNQKMNQKYRSHTYPRPPPACAPAPDGAQCSLERRESDNQQNPEMIENRVNWHLMALGRFDFPWNTRFTQDLRKQLSLWRV